MLKHLGSAYHAGRTAGGGALSTVGDGAKAAGWWKWKVDPYSIDAVLIYAQQNGTKADRARVLVTNRKLPANVYIDDRGLRFVSWDQTLADLDGALGE